MTVALAKNDKGELANKITIFRKTVIQEYLEWLKECSTNVGVIATSALHCNRHWI